MPLLACVTAPPSGPDWLTETQELPAPLQSILRPVWGLGGAHEKTPIYRDFITVPALQGLMGEKNTSSKYNVINAITEMDNYERNCLLST